jgi:hypothetical protein
MKTLGGITGRGFVKGDSRCWRKGRPKGFYEIRRVALAILNEDAIWADGRTISHAELILRRWSRSKNPKLQRLFFEYAFGPVPPTKAEAPRLEPGTVLRLSIPHEPRRWR